MLDKLNATTQLSRNTGLFASEIDQNLVMLDEKQGLYFCLNEVGKAVWQRLESPCTYTELLTSLMSDYQVGTAQCEADVEPFLQTMIQYRLVEVA